MTDPKEYGSKPTEERIETPFDKKDIPVLYHMQAEITDHPIIMDQFGVLRYKTTDTETYDWNQLAVDYQRFDLERDDFMQLYRATGSSLQLFDEVFGIELELIQLEKAHTRPIEDVLKDWDDAVCEDWPSCFELLASDLATGGTASIDEAIELLRIAAHLQREQKTEVKPERKFKRGNVVQLVKDLGDYLITEEGDNILVEPGALGMILTVDDSDDQPNTVAWINLNTINQCDDDELELYDINKDFPIDG